MFNKKQNDYRIMTDFDIGARVKRLREEKNLSLRELARRSGVSATQISEIERNLTAPTVPTLMKIIAALGGDLSIFFERNHSKSVSVVRKNERQQFIDRQNHVFLESLSNGITDTKLKIVLAHPPPGAENIPGGYQHPGEELIYVIKGKVQVTIAGRAMFSNEATAFTFAVSCGTPSNITDKEVRLISVITPPNY
jgi:transcriptional regulator with XRE-family HTH domain